jgi:hypothetical protein
MYWEGVTVISRCIQCCLVFVPVDSLFASTLFDFHAANIWLKINLYYIIPHLYTHISIPVFISLIPKHSLLPTYSTLGRAINLPARTQELTFARIRNTCNIN